MGVRRKGRELALQMLYEWDVTRAPFGEVVWSISAIRNPSQEAKDFGRALAEGTIRRVEEIDAVISAQSDSWRLSRMAAVDRNILRMAITEFLYAETPRVVVIDEAIEVARKYSGEESTEFVNGILDAIHLDLEEMAENARNQKDG